ncbi:putative periplasmic lipoprotein [Flaviaesturariibacter terrae]
MKKIFPALCALMTLAACNSNPTAKTGTTDTTGLAAYQQQGLQNIALRAELDSTEKAKSAVPAAQQVRYVTQHRTSSTSSSSRGGATGTTSSSGSTGSNSGTAAAPAKKKGISKTAKGAIIGGVAGAAGGALINKKNRGVGAVVGGLIGAGAGAVIGSTQDRKDGRQ